MKSVNRRIYAASWRRFRHLFPGVRGETNADYMDRLSRWLEEKW